MRVGRLNGYDERVTTLLARCAVCDRHLKTSPCPFCARRPTANLKSTALAASLMAFAQVSFAHADDSTREGVIMPTDDAVAAQVEPHYGVPPEPPPEDDPDDDDGDD